MMRSFFVLNNLSAIDRKSAPFATSLAAKIGAMVYLLHVIEPVTNSIRHPYPLHERLPEEITRNRRREIKTFQNNMPAGTMGKTKMPIPALPEKYEKTEPGGILFATNYFEENKALLNRILDVTKLFSAFIYHSAFTYS